MVVLEDILVLAVMFAQNAVPAEQEAMLAQIQAEVAEASLVETMEAPDQAQASEQEQVTQIEVALVEDLVVV